MGGIRLLRATTLMRLGQRDAARGELEATVRDLAGTGDDGLLERAWNALALERLRLGENEQCQAAFEAALEAAERAGSEGLVTRSNFARFELLRGRPDLAEEKLRELLALRRARPNATREGQVLLKLASAQRDLGRAGEPPCISTGRSTCCARREPSSVSAPPSTNELSSTSSTAVSTASTTRSPSSTPSRARRSTGGLWASRGRSPHGVRR
ncbi:MAG: hypothetical protein R2862_04300 [Thermoanaerobaculia bacterium]